MHCAYQAVPCWILPHWRVSESVPSQIGLFDLVVIDEASQSDISAMLALTRGKKVLIVGDHRQVSPPAVGLAEQRILELEQRCLQQQPHGRYMTPEQSIYDLARVVFAGNSVVLREHFRSAPPIVEFSNREFYQGSIRPLRIPRANERLDPPLVDVFVKGGRRRGDGNEAEARAIVDEIASILADPQLQGRSLLDRWRDSGRAFVALHAGVSSPWVSGARSRKILGCRLHLLPLGGERHSGPGASFMPELARRNFRCGRLPRPPPHRCNLEPG